MPLFSCRLALCVALVLAASESVAQSTLFKCTDEKGVTHYGQTMPAACAKKDVTELNKQGRPLRTLDAPLTPEQQKARDEAAAKKAADDRRVFEQRQKDLALLGTYGAEREIDVVRDKDLAQLTQRRKFLDNRMADLDARLVKINSQMEFYVAGRSQATKAREEREAREAKEAKDAKDAKDGKEAPKDSKARSREIPPQLQADFDRATNDRKTLQVEIDRLEADRAEITARYEGEKDRFRRLKSGMRPGTILDEKGNVLIEAALPRGYQPPAPPAPRR
ncbi:MAG: DUF4124 domain-containing protein [Burkholderiales bacterium]|nr:DUF4124 domain-containing protein [Nitrosomonadaceae bacterium]